MSKRAWDLFIFSAAVILFVTAVAKIFTATGTAEALGRPDPLIPLSNRLVFCLAGSIELFISGFLLIREGGQRLKLTLIAWLATNYLVYRIGLWWTGAPAYCDCLSNLNYNLFISPRTVRWVMLALLTWLLAGSYIFLMVEWIQSRRMSRLKESHSPTKRSAQLGGAYGN